MWWLIVSHCLRKSPPCSPLLPLTQHADNGTNFKFCPTTIGGRGRDSLEAQNIVIKERARGKSGDSKAAPKAGPRPPRPAPDGRSGARIRAGVQGDPSPRRRLLLCPGRRPPHLLLPRTLLPSGHPPLPTLQIEILKMIPLPLLISRRLRPRGWGLALISPSQSSSGEA